MRILFIESNFAYLDGFPRGFRDLGHEVQIVSLHKQEDLTSISKKFQPELIMTMGWGSENDTPQKHERIRQHVREIGVPHVYWATEDPHFTQVFTIPLINRMQPDFVFTLSKSVVDEYSKLGIRSAHMDFGYQPDVHYKTEVFSQYCCDIAVVANAYPDVLQTYPEHYRNHSLKTLITPLLQQKFRIDFWGFEWERLTPILGINIPKEWIHGFLPYTEANKVYSSAKIIIGLQNYKEQLTQRTYEILGSGGFLLTSDTPEISRLFTPGRDLVVSSSPEQTVNLVKVYLNKPEERRKISEKGRGAVSAHTYKTRAEYMIKILQKENILK